MILVAGSTGLLGNEICRILREEDKTVKALVRSTSDPAKIETLENYGARLVQADLKSPESLDYACMGVDTVISTASSTLSRQEGDTIETVDLKGQMNLIESAKIAGVKRFIFISFIDNPKIEFPLSDAKLKVENYLAESGMNYTILRSNWFMEVWLSAALGFDALNSQARIYGTGEKKISWISYLDLAKIVTQSIENHAVYYKAIDIGGPEALNPMEVVNIFEKTGNTKFQVEHISEVNLRAQLKTEKDPLQASFAGLMLQYANGIETNTDFMNFYNIDLTRVETYAEHMLKPEHV